jgi:5'-phosphate synthase pdxT subunit
LVTNINVSKTIKAGVLALQGDFNSHISAIQLTAKSLNVDAEVTEIRTSSEIEKLDLLVFPGGESSAMLKLLKADLKESIISFKERGGLIFGTCAGAILLADKVSNPKQFSFQFIDVEIERNSYGRQKSSFITKDLVVTELGKKYFNSKNPELEGIFIRAPKIINVGKQVQVLVTHLDTPVLVMQNNVLISTFHPELSPISNAEPSPIYQLIFQILRKTQ